MQNCRVGGRILRTIHCDVNQLQFLICVVLGNRLISKMIHNPSPSNSGTPLEWCWQRTRERKGRLLRLWMKEPPHCAAYVLLPCSRSPHNVLHSPSNIRVHSCTPCEHWSTMYVHLVCTSPTSFHQWYRQVSQLCHLYGNDRWNSLVFKVNSIYKNRKRTKHTYMQLKVL